jgi:dTDP-4-amino-4,6-dideoxygalactose transaminase
MAQGAFIGGPALKSFEEDFAAYCEVAHAVGVGNGTDALQLALRALDLAPGAEIIAPANTFVATIEAIALAGARPVLVDILPGTHHLDPEKAAAAVTERTRVLMPVHLYGDPVDMDPILDLAARRGLHVIEDAAQAHGARYKGRRCGSMGDLAAFSFYPGKNLGAYGDGGAVTTSRAEYAARIRQLGDHGSPRKFSHERLGTNSRLDALQAAVLQIKLARLEDWNAARRRVAAAYAARLAELDDLALPQERPGHEPVYHLYVVQSPRVEAIARALQAADIGFGYHYPKPVHLQPAYRDLGPAGSFPQAEKTAAEIISLPMFPELTETQIDHVVETVREAL